MKIQGRRMAGACSLIVAVGLVASACTKQQGASGDKSLTGVYTLESVNGNSVPATVTHQGVSVHVREGTFTINADGTCRSRTVFTPPSGSEVVREVNARYTRNGANLTMRWEGAGVTVGKIGDDVFTMDNEGMEFIYRK